MIEISNAFYQFSALHKLDELFHQLTSPIADHVCLESWNLPSSQKLMGSSSYLLHKSSKGSKSDHFFESTRKASINGW